MTKLKYIAAALLLFMVSFVGGCVGADAKTAEADEQDRMVEVSSQAANYGWFEIYKDNETGVHYLVHDRNNGTGICVMVDAEGKPLVDKE